jgi:hypothetical protein
VNPPLRTWPRIAIALLCATLHPDARTLQLTQARAGHQIHNRQCFSPDGRFIYYDSRNDETRLGDSRAIGRVEITTGRTEILHRTADTAIGAVTCHPREPRLAFILGVPGLPYAPHQRGGATLSPAGDVLRLDARDVHPPFTRGASRGGSHAFHWSPDGSLLSFTYNDALAPRLPAPRDLRTIGILIPGQPVTVENPLIPHDFDGSTTTAMVVPVTPGPRPGSDEILRAFDEDWLDARTLAFQGIVLRENGDLLTEVFLAELPADLFAAVPGAANAGDTMPPVMSGVRIRRLTLSGGLTHPGVQGPRHWVRASPDGKTIAFLAKDDAGIVQIHGVPRAGGKATPLSHLEDSVQDVFDWSPCGKFLACIAGGRVQLVDAANGRARPLTPPRADDQRPRYATVFSPDGKWIATNIPTPHPDGGTFLQVHLMAVQDPAAP